ncbi:F-box domain-containing protein [Mycena indigotica]|uniref:F-box domain-containing protein n=1 Tax=Mycena indigotica TaxID=2126181 RepID=A0A8H6W919_9AGAR|nr:F-box domain-containing protein [Mycena indigotica]KAF7307561.1 F-box domain-containing protein [Mycena indigotica]
MRFLDLQEDVLLLTCSLLSVGDILLLRQVCSTMDRLMRLKSVWLTQLAWLLRQGIRIPAYIEDHLALSSPELELLVRRLSYASQKWTQTENRSPFRTWSINLPQSITWLHLAQGRWLFVASSDDKVSKLSCWDIFRIFKGNTEPIAQGYLPDVVKTGKAEVQDREIVLALGLGSQSNSTRIITLRNVRKEYSLLEIACIPHSTHVLMLSGSFVGCAIRQQSNVPHLINWRESRIVEILPPPGGLEAHGRRNVPLAMTLWDDKLVIIRSLALELYDFPSAATEASVAYRGSIKPPTIWEVQVLPLDLADSPLRLVILSPVGLELIALDPLRIHELYESDETCPTTCIVRDLPDWLFDYPWYRLCVTPDGTRATWLEAAHLGEEDYHHPRFLSVLLPVEPEQVNQNNTPQVWEIDPQSDPAIWARPQIKVDETLGLTVVGNCFGELGIYDFAHGTAFPSNDLNRVDDSVNGHSLSESPIQLSHRRGPRSRMTQAEFRDATAHWSQDGIVDWIWVNDWYEDRDWARVFRWGEDPGRFGWSIDHEYGFPGEVLLQAYTPREYAGDTPCILFRVGNRYLVEDGDGFIRSWPNNVDHGFIVEASDIEDPMHPTIETENSVFWKSFRMDWKTRTPRRNRWVEQQERGGCTDLNLHWQEDAVATNDATEE